MKKIFNILLTILITLNLTGCSLLEKNNKDINAERGTNYVIDFMDFVDITLYGSEGFGFLEIKPRDFSLSDFENEDTYIKVKKIIDSLDLRVNSDTKKASSYLMVTPNENLHNGDIVSINIREGWVNPYPEYTVNTESFLLQIYGLPEGDAIDLFNDSSVLFYGLDGSTDVYAYKKNNGSIPKDILDKLKYDISVSDEELKVNKTILTIKTTMDEKTLTEGDDPAYTMETYLGRKGYVAESTKEKVLTKILTPIDNNTIDKEKLMIAVLTYLNSNDIIIQNNIYSLESINTIQQAVNSNNIKNQFTYFVTFSVSRAGERQCMSVKLKIVEIDGEYVIAEKAEPIQKTNENYCTLAASGYVLVADYNKPADIEAEITDDNQTSIKDSVKNSEVK